MNPDQRNSIFTPIVLVPVNGLSAGIVLVYMTPSPDPNTSPSSLVEMGLQGQSLTLNVIIEDREIVLVIQNLSILAQIVSQGIRRVVETYNSHMWMSTVLLQPMNYQSQGLPFLYDPIMGTRVYNPMHQTPSMATPGCFPTMGQPRPMQRMRAQMSNDVTSSHQVCL